MTEEFLRKISEAIRARGSRPSHVQYQEMVDRGVIDRDGNVTIRRPEAPASAGVVTVDDRIGS